MVRNGWLVVGIVSVGLVAACKKDDPATGTSAGDTTKKVDPAQHAEQPAPGPTAKIKSSANVSDLALLPVDAELVMGVNFSQVQQSALWKQFVEPMLLKGDAAVKLGELKARCGFDPMTAVKSLSVGVRGLGTPTVDGVAVVHGVEKAQLVACLDKVKADATNLEITQDGDVTSVKGKNGKTIAFSFINDTTALVLIGAGATPAGVKQAAAGTSALQSSQAFVEMYNKINTQDSVWLLMNGKAKVFEKVASLMKPQAVYGSINVSDGLTVDLRVRVDSPDQATQLAQGAKQQASAAASMFPIDKLDINSDGSDIKVSVAVSAAKLEGLITQISGMVRGKMGGMAGMGGMGSP